MGPDEVLSSGAWAAKAKKRLPFFEGVRRLLKPRPDDPGARDDTGRASRAADGESEGPTGGASNGED